MWRFIELAIQIVKLTHILVEIYEHIPDATRYPRKDDDDPRIPRC